MGVVVVVVDDGGGGAGMLAFPPTLAYWPSVVAFMLAYTKQAVIAICARV